MIAILHLEHPSYLILITRDGCILKDRENSADCRLHGPSMFAVNAKIYGVPYKQSSSIAFDETSSYWSALKSS